MSNNLTCLGLQEAQTPNRTDQSESRATKVVHPETNKLSDEEICFYSIAHQDKQEISLEKESLTAQLID